MWVRSCTVETWRCQACKQRQCYRTTPDFYLRSRLSEELRAAEKEKARVCGRKQRRSFIQVSIRKTNSGSLPWVDALCTYRRWFDDHDVCHNMFLTRPQINLNATLEGLSECADRKPDHFLPFQNDQNRKTLQTENASVPHLWCKTLGKEQK